VFKGDYGYLVVTFYLRTFELYICIIILCENMKCHIRHSTLLLDLKITDFLCRFSVYIGTCSR